MAKIRTTSLASAGEQKNREKLTHLYLNNPVPNSEKISNSGLFLKRQELSKILFFNELYQKTLPLHGIIIEFGCRWGQNLVTLNNLRGIHEPYNYNRRIVGFDTFTGFHGISEKDGKNEIIKDGSLSVTPNYEDYLSQVLQAHENESPLSHISKNYIKKGNATEELKKYLEENPQTIIAFAWFDFDIYTPTLECLQTIKPFLAKGAILGFDELNDPKFPGETLALKEFAEINLLQIRRNRYSGMQSYIVFE
ncbi:MAG TPA: crotonobetainyl-CoA--carnitine CoA-transferase [Salinimicrobium sp.]|nr:crotonobetainyl-CoA--carnitine CoA-transferase [Salinimicrobium sp.]